MNQETIAALNEAIQDEYKARATYRKVIETFGSIAPFVNIVEAEDRHANALLSLFRDFGLELPADDWPARVSVPPSVAAACEAAVAAEIDNMAMYDRLLAAVDEPAVRRVLERLQEASRERHLPAFRRCLERDGAVDGPGGQGGQGGQGGPGGQGRQRRRRRRGG